MLDEHLMKHLGLSDEQQEAVRSKMRRHCNETFMFQVLWDTTIPWQPCRHALYARSLLSDEMEEEPTAAAAAPSEPEPNPPDAAVELERQSSTLVHAASFDAGKRAEQFLEASAHTPDDKMCLRWVCESMT